MRDEKLKVDIGECSRPTCGVYGARKVWRQLNREGIAVARWNGSWPVAVFLVAKQSRRRAADFGLRGPSDR